MTQQHHIRPAVAPEHHADDVAGPVPANLVVTQRLHLALDQARYRLLVT
jgi:hypothetical protein